MPSHKEMTMCTACAGRALRCAVASLLLAGGWAAPVLGDGPTNSSPIAITSDDRFVWVVNPENDSVSVIRVEGNTNTRLAVIPVGEHPIRLAINEDRKVYVTNQR